MIKRNRNRNRIKNKRKKKKKRTIRYFQRKRKGERKKKKENKISKVSQAVGDVTRQEKKKKKGVRVTSSVSTFSYHPPKIQADVRLVMTHYSLHQSHSPSRGLFDIYKYFLQRFRNFQPQLSMDTGPFLSDLGGLEEGFRRTLHVTTLLLFIILIRIQVVFNNA